MSDQPERLPTVRGGSFCTPGSAGRTTAGTLVDCRPGRDGRHRYQLAAGEPSAKARRRAVAPSLDERIRAAYRDLCGAPGNWVGLADLRDYLVGVPRDQLDAALRALARTDGVRIIPVANVKALAPRDHAAALRIGVEDNHTIQVTS